MAEICISRDHEFNPQSELSSSDPSIAVVSYCEIIFICFVYFVGRTIYQFNIAQTIHSLNAMVTNHLRAPYGVYFTQNRTILRRPYGAHILCTHRTGTGRFLFKIYIVRFQRCPSGHRPVHSRASYDV